MVCACVSLTMGLSPPRFIEPGCKINAAHYQTLLSEHYIPLVAGAHGPGFAWQEDNAPSHAAKQSKMVLRELLASVGGQALTWPANSPDLSPLDYSLWALWDAEVQKSVGDSSPTVAQLRAAIVQAHGRLDPAVVRRSVEAWPSRLQACLDAGGFQFEHALK